MLVLSVGRLSNFHKTFAWMGVLPPKCVLTILTIKIWDPRTSSTKSSILVLRTVLNVLTLKFSVFPKPPSNITVQSLFKHAPK